MTWGRSYSPCEWGQRGAVGLRKVPEQEGPLPPRAGLFKRAGGWTSAHACVEAEAHACTPADAYAPKGQRWDAQAFVGTQ